jgi:hypothetical protein
MDTLERMAKAEPTPFALLTGKESELHPSKRL